ncbi:protein CEBPZOS-like isoform X3 [Megalops cyprinoides]|uniref:protein CEBPZOS-like isoform X3 n=1 Tax=Megalops cyprinoides TaxID=118141 RepID=UPI001864C872|nr:protein CEBPZOS-like isoform X3 [Megalops cyprinoides]
MRHHSRISVEKHKMAPKPMEPFARKVFRGVLVLELAGVVGAYLLFQGMDASRVYYKSNEWAGIYGIREADMDAWAAKKS